MLLDPQIYGTFLVVALAAILSPGPDSLLIIRAALSGGNGHGFAALIDVQIGLLGHLAAAVFGLSLLLLAVPLALKGVALAGALYLCWLGYRNIRAGTAAIDRMEAEYRRSPSLTAVPARCAAMQS